MTIQVPSTTIEGASGNEMEGNEIIANPAVSPDSTDYLGDLYNKILLPVGTSLLTAKVDQTIAMGNAKAQQKLNQYHAADPSVGPNDPRAALAASARTKAQQWLPDWMLAPAEKIPASNGQVIEGPRRMSIVGWGALGILGLLFLWLIVRIVRR